MIYADPSALWLNLVLSFVIGGLAVAGMQDGWSFGWACFGVILAVARLVDLRSYPARRSAGLLARARRKIIVLCSLTGVYWGCSGLVLLMSDDPFLQFWVINASTAALSIAVARQNSVAEAMYNQVLSSMTPLAFCCLFTSNIYFQVYAGLVMLYSVALIKVTRHLHSQTVRLLIADEANIALLTRETEANARLEEANRRLEAMATTDGLTGIANRRCFNSWMTRTWRDAARDGGCLSLLLIDVDKFKSYNDNFGHQAGDACLQEIATCLAGTIQRPRDLAARYGGEEFAVIIAESDHFGTIDIAERVRAAVEALALPSPTGKPVTISVGSATCRPAGAETDDIKALVAAADGKLYEAKCAGRNCVRSVDVSQAPTQLEAAPWHKAGRRP